MPVLDLKSALAKLPFSRHGLPVTPVAAMVRCAATESGPGAAEFAEIAGRAASCGSVRHLRLTKEAAHEVVCVIDHHEVDLPVYGPELVEEALAPPFGGLWVEWQAIPAEYGGSAVPAGGFLLVVEDRSDMPSPRSCAQVYTTWEGERGLQAAHARVHLPIFGNLQRGVWRVWERRLQAPDYRPLGCFTADDLGTVGWTAATKAALANVSADLLEALGTPRGTLIPRLARPFLDGPAQRVPVMPWFVIATLYALALYRDEDQIFQIGPRGVVAPVAHALAPPAAAAE